jgi:calcineurin-like phosphoesterase family protein/2'-5' RNA ligase
MNPYLIEIRLVGRVKHDIINLIKSVGNIFETNVYKVVPHVTLIGPFHTNNESRLVKDFEANCKRTELINYKIDGVDLFSKSGVVYLDLAPNEALTKFRSALCTQLQQYCKLSFWDFQDPFKFHVTVATRVEANIINDVLRYMNSCKPLIYELPLLRATLLKHGKILSEYDFVLGRKLDHYEIKNFMQNKESISDYYCAINLERRKTSRVYFTSDLKINDKYTMRTCARPFSNLDTMNTTLVNNWNAEVTAKDTIYFMGDLTHQYATNEEFNYWLSKLNGNIIFVRGDNDRAIPEHIKQYNEYEETLNGFRFFMTHSPENIPDDVLTDNTIWTLHGHTQNKRMSEYPFIDRDKQTINVSTDVTNFRPVSLEEITMAIKAKPKIGEYELMHEKIEKPSLFRVRAEVA